MSDESKYRRLLSIVNCKSLGSSIARLADRLPSYFAELRDAGFTCCHVNDDWIASHCNESDLALHKRYLVEFAREVLATGKPSPDFGDAQDCQSQWLNELKATRLAKYGRYEDLWKSVATRHLEQLSPGWQEFFRVKESSAPFDQMHVADQMANYVHRRAEEMAMHSGLIAIYHDKMPPSRDESSLQAFLADQLAAAFEDLGVRTAPTLERNQVLRRDEQVIAMVFNLTDECLFVLKPIVVLPGRSTSLIGNMSIGFRLMTSTALSASTFEFGRDTVIQLNELLPNKFNGYGRFESSEEFCLNMLAWTAALRILLPDVLHTLRAAATGPAH